MEAVRPAGMPTVSRPSCCTAISRDGSGGHRRTVRAVQHSRASWAPSRGDLLREGGSVDGAVDLELQEETVGAGGRERRQGSTLSARAGQRPELREDLTESELRVLRFLPSNLSAPEIGRELYLSLSTVKTHMRHIYAKLGVHRRTEAIDRARELGLLAPSARRR